MRSGQKTAIVLDCRLAFYYIPGEREEDTDTGTERAAANRPKYIFYTFFKVNFCFVYVYLDDICRCLDVM